MDKAQYDKYIEILREKLSDYRLNHSIEVAKSARELAKKYGGDEEKMFLAGLLHDILKEASVEESMAYAEKYGVSLTPLERRAKKLWHAMLGAQYVKNELNIDDEDVISAIRYHTTGKKDMTLSEKIIFIADFISADRDYNGVESMREKAKISLEAAMLEGIEFTIISLVEEHKAVHPDTFEAFNDLVLKGE